MAGPKRRVNIAGERLLREARSHSEGEVSPRAPEDAARSRHDPPRTADVSSEDESGLFREATRDVRPLDHDRRAPTAAKPPPRARFTRADRAAVLDESLIAEPDDPYLEGGEAAAFARPGVPESVLRKLRRGHYRVQAELDLHGLTVREAKEILRGFLAEALRRDLRCVRIVHGKGLRSGPRGPVLKSMVIGLLRRSGRVLAFVSARTVDGGTGAVYVLLAPP